MRIIGFDPGYVNCGLGIIEVEGDKYHVVEAAVIYPAWKAEAKSLEKVDAMVKGLSDFLKCNPECQEGDLLIVEGQESYGRRGGFKGANDNVLIRMGKVAGAFYGMSDAEEKHFVLPKTWNGSRSKECNHPKILSALQNGEPKDWPWTVVTKPKDYNHAIDAVGMAIWGYEKYLRDSET